MEEGLGAFKVVKGLGGGEMEGFELYFELTLNLE